jgi:hypothetical protein
MAVIVGPTPTISSKEQTWVNSEVAKYPDLDPVDQVLVGDFINAYIHRHALPDRYQDAKSTIIARIRQLQSAVDTPEQPLQSAVDIPGEPEASFIKMIARLINLSEVLNMARVSSGQYLEPPYCAEPLRQCSPGRGPNALPTELEIMLNVGEGDNSFLLYFNQHVRHVFFVPDIKAKIKLVRLHEIESNGVSEPITRTAIVDPRDEEWEQAAALVHEAGHIEYDHLTADNPARQGHKWGERFADIREKDYLGNLLTQKWLSKETRQEINRAHNNKLKKIAELNLELRLKPNDYSLNK